METAMRSYNGWDGGNLTAALTCQNATNARHSNEKRWGSGRVDKAQPRGVVLSRAENCPAAQKRVARSLYTLIEGSGA